MVLFSGLVQIQAFYVRHIAFYVILVCLSFWTAMNGRPISVASTCMASLCLGYVVAGAIAVPHELVISTGSRGTT